MTAARAECPPGDPAADEIVELISVGTVAALRRTMIWWMRNYDAADESLPAEAIGDRVGRFIAGGLAGALRPEPAATS
jgi:hypothetical protein